jgi:hypothetical protein
MNLSEVKVFTAICAFIAGLMPAIYSALKLDDHLEQCKTLAGEFKNLQDRFRQAALVSSKKSFTEFEADVKPLIDRMDEARGVSLTPPRLVLPARSEESQIRRLRFRYRRQGNR